MKKAQLQMMESVVVLLFLFVLIAFGIIFFISYQRSRAGSKASEYQALNAIKKAQVLNFLPELECSFDGLTKPDCYDIIKIRSFQQVYQENEASRLDYEEYLGSLKIEIKEFNPDANAWEATWEVYDNPPKNNRGSQLIHIPISLFNATDDMYSFGMIFLRVYN